ncbi:MAG: hypothetical protein ACLRMW_17670, partial [[Clostridium] symbiosum]
FSLFLRKSRVMRRDAMKSKLFTTINGVFAVSVHHLLQFGRRLNCNKITDRQKLFKDANWPSAGPFRIFFCQFSFRNIV